MAVIQWVTRTSAVWRGISGFDSGSAADTGAAYHTGSSGTPLFGPQSLSGIELRRAPRRDDASRHGYQQQRNGDQAKYCRVERPGLVKQGTNQPRCAGTGYQSECQAKQGRFQSIHQHQAQELVALRAECNANADLVRALGNEIGQHSI